MKIEKLTNIIENGGATLTKDEKESSYKSGYQVSKKDCYIFDVANANKILRAVNGLLNSISAGEFVGLWIDGGKCYIDISERVERLSAAIVAGIERKQKSIFDWCLQRCITLNA